MKDRLRIFVSGMIAADPHQGGGTWAILQYLLGLRSMGHDVYFVEPIAPSAIRPARSSLSTSVNARYFHDVTTAFALAGRAALLLQDTRETVGLRYETVLEATKGADLLINISGMLTDAGWLAGIPRRIYLDVDPGFNQLWHAFEGLNMRFAGHTHFFTVGLGLGKPGCDVPTCGRPWIPMLPPVVLAAWPLATGSGEAWTTVGSWRGYGSIQRDGVTYGQKAHSVRRLIDLPGRTRARLRPALAIHPGEVKDLEMLRANAWDIVDPARVASTPASYHNFVQLSRGEIGVAKSGYVESRCGWFSDRSACYLASGRPVVAQDTGFSRFLPTGNGLFAFTTAEEAANAIDAVERDEPRHRRAARDIAHEYFRADRVLGAMLTQAGATAPAPVELEHGA
jgi:hypothetical protein